MNHCLSNESLSNNCRLVIQIDDSKSDDWNYQTWLPISIGTAWCFTTFDLFRKLNIPIESPFHHLGELFLYIFVSQNLQPTYRDHNPLTILVSKYDGHPSTLQESNISHQTGKAGKSSTQNCPKRDGRSDP